jgi:predicted transcriptional regulator
MKEAFIMPNKKDEAVPPEKLNPEEQASKEILVPKSVVIDNRTYLELIAEILSEASGFGLSLPNITKRVDLSQKTAEELVETLVKDEMLKTFNMGPDMIYKSTNRGIRVLNRLIEENRYPATRFD